MPSSKVKPANHYPAHWHRLMEWLARQPLANEPSVIVVEEGDFKASNATMMNKLNAFRRACMLRGAGVDAALLEMFKAREVKFGFVGGKIVATRRATPDSFIRAAKVIKTVDVFNESNDKNS